MEEKYKHLRKIENDLIRFAIRYKKIYGNNASNKTIMKIIQEINLIKLNDNVYLDILNLICDNGISHEMILDEIRHKQDMGNEAYPYLTFNINYSLTPKENVLKFMKLKLSNFNLLTEPVVYLFKWSNSIKGAGFYLDLNKKIKKALKIYDIICSI